MSARSDALPAEAWKAPLSRRSAFAGDRIRYAVSVIELHCASDSRNAVPFFDTISTGVVAEWDLDHDR